MKKRPKWKIYQEQAARFFDDLGFSTSIEQPVFGARGEHKVDVFVTGKVHGLDLQWVVECKHWAANVTKEKVLALQAIVQDIGADKGILLSEVGFQSGAVKVAKNTNLLLTSLDDLKEEMKNSFAETIISSLHWRLSKVENRLSAIDRMEKEDYKFTDALVEKKKLMFLEYAFNDALAGQYPTVYAIGPNDSRIAANSFDELVREADMRIKHAEAFADKHEPTSNSK